MLILSTVIHSSNTIKLIHAPLLPTGIISRDLLIGATGAVGTAVLGDTSEFPEHPLEFWGQICCTLAAQPNCMVGVDETTGFLYVSKSKTHCKF